MLAQVHKPSIREDYLGNPKCKACVGQRKSLSRKRGLEGAINLARWHTPVIAGLERLRQQDYGLLEASLGESTSNNS